MLYFDFFHSIWVNEYAQQVYHIHSIFPRAVYSPAIDGNERSNVPVALLAVTSVSEVCVGTQFTINYTTAPQVTAQK